MIYLNLYRNLFCMYGIRVKIENTISIYFTMIESLKTFCVVLKIGNSFTIMNRRISDVSICRTDIFCFCRTLFARIDKMKPVIAPIDRNIIGGGSKSCDIIKKVRVEIENSIHKFFILLE